MVYHRKIAFCDCLLEMIETNPVDVLLLDVAMYLSRAHDWDAGDVVLVLYFIHPQVEKLVCTDQFL